jgi:hypothetical protein
LALRHIDRADGEEFQPLPILVFEVQHLSHAVSAGEAIIPVLRFVSGGDKLVCIEYVRADLCEPRSNP